MLEVQEPKEPPPGAIGMVERLREHGCSIVTAVDLAAEETGTDPRELAARHFAWQLEPLVVQERAGNSH